MNQAEKKEPSTKEPNKWKTNGKAHFELELSRLKVRIGVRVAAYLAIGTAAFLAILHLLSKLLIKGHP